MQVRKEGERTSSEAVLVEGQAVEAVVASAAAAPADGGGGDAFFALAQSALSSSILVPFLFLNLHCRRSWIHWCSQTLRRRTPSF